MDYLFILQSVNKIAVIAFVIILILIGVEMSWIWKGKKKNEKIRIPDFTSRFGQRNNVVTVTNPTQNNGKKRSSARKLVIAMLLIMLIGLIGVFATYIKPKSILVQKKPQGQTSPVITPLIELVESEGIVLFTTDWKKLDNKTVTLETQNPIYIGVHTVPDATVDRARIRVNKNVWDLSDETEKFDSKQKVYYREYVIATSESSLKIDAQLHSQESGWLSE